MTNVRESAVRFDELVTQFKVKRIRGGSKNQVVCAVDHVSLDVAEGEVLGIVGESGCGKTTLVRTLMGLERPASGSAYFDGHRMTNVPARELRSLRPGIQMVFQDPYTSLDPRMSILQLISEPWDVHPDRAPKADRRARAAELLERVGINSSMMNQTTRALSGGERQRISLARALALNPKVLVLDEPVSALDVSIQAQIIELLRTLQRDSGVTVIFITHDLGVVRSIATRVAVMYLGRIVEEGAAEDVYHHPLHPYTRALLSAAPRVGGDVAGNRRIKLGGEVPSPLETPSGCAFRTRCWKAQEVCAQRAPALDILEPSHSAACYFPEAVQPQPADPQPPATSADQT
jgi:oligopeptide transport system ATP-binding protein